MAGFNLPDDVDSHDPRATWNQGMSDKALTREANLANKGLTLVNELAGIVEDLELYFNFVPLIAALKERI